MDKQNIIKLKMMMSEVIVGDFVTQIQQLDENNHFGVDEELTNKIQTSPEGLKFPQGEYITLILKPGRIELQTEDVASISQMSSLAYRYFLVAKMNGTPKAVGINCAILFKMDSFEKEERINQKYFSEIKRNMVAYQYSKIISNTQTYIYTLAKHLKDNNNQQMYVFGINNHNIITDLSKINRILLEISKTKFNMNNELDKLLHECD